MIVGLGHQAQVGKDTAANFLVERYGFKRLAFADKLKQVLYDINPIVTPLVPQDEARIQTIVDVDGWEVAKTIFEVRRMLQELGVAARDHIDRNAWVTPVIKQLDIYQDFVITDVRFPNEFAALYRKGARMVRITRSEAQGNAGTHQSEVALDREDVEWSATVENDGTILEFEESLTGVLGL